MEQTETTISESTEWKQRSQELVRPVQGRMLAGVAKGIADNFGIAEWIPRVFFIVTAFMGGLGIVLYAACWAFIRSEDESRSVADRFFSDASTSRSWLGIALIVVAVIIVASNFTFLAGEVVWAAAFLVVGLLLYLGYIPFGEQERTSPQSEEGVQPMTTDTPLSDADIASQGDSPTYKAATPAPAPTPTPPDLVRTQRERSMLGRLTIGFILVGLGVLAVLDNIEGLPIEAHPRHYMGLAVTILGVGLLVGSIAGRARWLILVGAILVPTLIFSPAFEYGWSDVNVERQIRPLTVAEIEPVSSIDFGTLVIDLRDIAWEGETVDLDASVDIGRIVIYLPDGVGISGGASVDIGRVAEPGRSTGGLGDPRLEWDEQGVLGTVLLDAEVNIGSIEIRR